MDFFAQGDALICHWLHKEPEDDLHLWAAQVSQALWLEGRYCTQGNKP